MDLSAHYEIYNIMENSSLNQCPMHIMCIMKQVSDKMDEETGEGIYDRLGPILDQVVALGPGNYQSHPTITKVLRWLMDPQHTVHEFNYVVGPMGQYTFDVFGRFKNLYLGLIAAEALAVRRPVLDGPWAHSAWLTIWLNNDFCHDYNYGTASDQLSDWIICMMGDPVLCPIQELRFEFMIMFCKMVSVTAQNGSHSLKAFMSTLSTIGDAFVFGDRTKVTPYVITCILNKFVESGNLLEYAQTVAHLLTSQISNIISDVSCSYGLNPNRNTGNEEMKAVMTLFFATSGYANLELQKYEKVHFYDGQETQIEDISYLLLLLVTYFKKTCQTPYLINVTALCVMEVLELVLLVNIARKSECGEVYPNTLPIIHKILNELCNGNSCFNIVLSPVGQMIDQTYPDRLSNLRYKIERYQPESDIICSLLFHCNLF